MISTKFQSLAKVQSIFRRQAQLSSHLQKSQSSNFVCQPQLSKTGRHLTIYLRSSAHHDQGVIPQHRSILVRVSSIEIALSPQRHLLVAGHDTGNGRRESLTTVLATEIAVTIRPREYILIVHLGQMVIAVRIDMTLKMRADAVIVLMTEMSAPVVPIGHPTGMLEILRTDLAEIRFLMTGNRFSWITITLLFRR